MKAVIVDDEKNSRELLITALTEYADGIQVVGEADSVSSAIKVIKKTNPEVLFLDIELPDGKGFDIIDGLEQSYKVVFITAYDEFAIKAIRYAAIDYLVKPLDLEDLDAAIERVKSRPVINKQHRSFLQRKLNDDKNLRDKIMVPSHKGYQFVDFDSILSIEVKDAHVFFYLDNGLEHLTYETLSYYEDLLPIDKFYRIHKSHIINYRKVIDIEYGRTGKVTLINGKKLDIAARRKSAFLNAIEIYK